MLLWASFPSGLGVMTSSLIPSGCIRARLPLPSGLVVILPVISTNAEPLTQMPPASFSATTHPEPMPFLAVSSASPASLDRNEGDQWRHGLRSAGGNLHCPPLLEQGHPPPCTSGTSHSPSGKLRPRRRHSTSLPRPAEAPRETDTRLSPSCVFPCPQASWSCPSSHPP
ncbi:hypothetical protein HJG60_010696 [Phyllostomus discolor]|uniref:Uncharacterized protein n=1 Tax=Phyllostomus discolor TaxID=89673 RepID=A0A834AHX2_9CHIR|nr:hypothetical protein HJG60_010696 [Phyllostomus discolor]